MDLRERIEDRLRDIGQGELREAALSFFETLGYSSTRTSEIGRDWFAQQITEKRAEKARLSDWKSISILFQLTEEEVTGHFEMFSTNGLDAANFNSYLFVAIDLDDLHYTRTDFSNMNREINRIFGMPVMVLLRYGGLLTFAITARRPNMKDQSKDVLEKITLIKDIDTNTPHRAHLEILSELALPSIKRNSDMPTITSFNDLHEAWRKVLDISELNRKFYRELSAWYFWAVSQVEFPKDGDPDRNKRNHTNVIRLITRLIFVWFLREKHLVPQELFSEKWQQDNLNSHLDKSAYYKAILQNLFFATLNQQMNEDGIVNRRFRDSHRDSMNRNKDYGNTRVYRYAALFKEPEKAVEVLSGVPYLNGGLFECLDTFTEDEEIRIDGFSERKNNKLHVPDKLFFSPEHIVDNSQAYNDKKHRKDRVRGIVEILRRYKFTVEENTPIEEEIALDPELLGRVFENLLAAYNPETSQTARKETGSYYTPREIVDYMVDESLISFIHSRHPDIEEQKLRTLFTYGEQETQLTVEERERVLHALSHKEHSVRIIDPACGSGAFPMGILQKIVYVLEKLDPDNALYREMMVDEACDLPGESQRQTIKYIDDMIREKKINYLRKVRLIRDAIYGVDIQPIAIQISRLRFFISLIVDQKADPQKSNLGLEPLPNLESKFVAADSLTKLDDGEQLYFKGRDVERLEESLERIRKQHFDANTARQKKNLRQKDTETRQRLKDALINSGFKERKASLIADWNPYNPVGYAEFFDPRHMFGRESFDIVIANPPYIHLEKMPKETKQRLKATNYKTYEARGDIYCLFYERGTQLLSHGGTLCYITSNKWMRAAYGKKLRGYFTSFELLRLIDFAGTQVFNATVDTNILLLRNERTKKREMTAVSMGDDYSIGNSIPEYIEANGVTLRNLSEESWVVAGKEEMAIKRKIEERGTPLKDWDISINYGIKTGYNEAFIIDGKKRDELIAKDPKSSEIIKPILRGRDIKRYRAEFADKWVIATFPALHIDIDRYPAVKDFLIGFKPKLVQEGILITEDDRRSLLAHAAKHGINAQQKDLKKSRKKTGNEWFETQDQIGYYEEFEKEKIIWIELVDDGRFSFAEAGVYSPNTTYLVTGHAIKYLASIMNSRTVNWYFDKICAKSGVGTNRWIRQYVELIPIPQIPESEQKPFEDIVDQILAAKEKGEDTKELEDRIDIMVYHLYGLTYDEALIIDPDLPSIITREDYNNPPIQPPSTPSTQSPSNSRTLRPSKGTDIQDERTGASRTSATGSVKGKSYPEALEGYGNKRGHFENLSDRKFPEPVEGRCPEPVEGYDSDTNTPTPPFKLNQTTIHDNTPLFKTTTNQGQTMPKPRRKPKPQRVAEILDEYEIPRDEIPDDYAPEGYNTRLGFYARFFPAVMDKGRKYEEYTLLREVLKVLRARDRVRLNEDMREELESALKKCIRENTVHKTPYHDEYFLPTDTPTTDDTVQNPSNSRTLRLSKGEETYTVTSRTSVTESTLRPSNSRTLRLSKGTKKVSGDNAQLAPRNEQRFAIWKLKGFKLQYALLLEEDGKVKMWRMRYLPTWKDRRVIIPREDFAINPDELEQEDMVIRNQETIGKVIDRGTYTVSYQDDKRIKYYLSGEDKKVTYNLLYAQKMKNWIVFER